jgi:PKD repeat protein
MDVVVQNGGGNDCLADFYYTIDSVGGDYTIVNFFDTSTPVGLIDTWYWDFGDGTTSTEQNPVHTFNEAGQYNVCLTITTDSISCTSTYCEIVYIQLVEDLYLGGNVFADIYQLDHGFAYAYKEEDGVITDVFSEMIDTLGYYLFYPMAEAGYYVKVEPSPSSSYFSTHMPTYYGDVANWADAILIDLDDNVYTADINLIPIVQTISGPGIIAGNITHGTADKANTPAVDVQIMLANEQGEFVGLTYSDDEGKFEFTSLSIGTYALFAEVMGINMTPKDFILTDNTPEISDISMIMSTEEIYFGPNGIESIYIDNVSNVYPNPVMNKIRMDIDILKPSTIKINIYNQMGQKLIMEQFNIGNSQTIEVNTSSLKPGMYFLEIISDDNYQIARKFIKQ